MVVARRIYVVTTIGTSPGVVAELVYNLSERRVRGINYAPDSRIEGVIAIGTQHEQVLLSARTVPLLIRCCLGLNTRIEIDAIGARDVIDEESYREYYERVKERLSSLLEKAGADHIVVLDVTGGRASMAVAAFEAAYNTVGRGRLYVTTTQIPPNMYKPLQDHFTELKEKLEEALQRIREAGPGGDPCRIIDETLSTAALCRLVTKQATTAVLRRP